MVPLGLNMDFIAYTSSS